MIRGVLFLIVGLVLLFMPYEKFKTMFPKAPSPVAVKVLGGIVCLAGLGTIVLMAGI